MTNLFEFWSFAFISFWVFDAQFLDKFYKLLLLELRLLQGLLFHQSLKLRVVISSNIASKHPLQKPNDQIISSLR